MYDEECQKQAQEFTTEAIKVENFVESVNYVTWNRPYTTVCNVVLEGSECI